MSVQWSQVKTWSSSSLSAYSGTVSSKRDRVLQQAASIQQNISGFQGQGDTADALRTTMGTAHTALSTLADDLAEVCDALDAAVPNVEQVSEAVKTVESSASSMQCTIDDNGKPTCHYSGEESNSYCQVAEAIVAGKITEAIALANYADESLSRALGKVGTEGRTSSTSRQGTHKLSKTEQERFKNMSPEERADYWSKQSYEQKQYLCDHYPEMVGNADGVEGWARDRANRINLSEKKLAAEKEVEALKAAVNDPQQESLKQKNQEALAKAEHAVEAYNKIESSLDNGISLEDYQHGKKGDPISLLTLQDDGRRVKAAVAQGDVDNAKHVSTFVPGIGTTVEGSLHNYIRQAGNLRQAAADQGNMPLKDVAVVSWLGYDAPGEPKFSNYGDIASPNLAKEGSDRLAGFLTGMQASREHGAGDAHMSLVGHSYGSTTSGMAATKVKSGVIDDLVLFGSPGMGTFNPSDLHVDEGHRWVSGVPNGDWVQGVGSLVRGKIGFGGLGKNPMDDDSTFTHLSDDATGYEGYNHDAKPNKWWRFDTSNHSVYLEKGTETLQDIGRVVAGVK
ncbi:alpha/beta hydrolase [uncultured Actinomyces sp.]|uniref:alpha/beta hydrolase n=1 Tax=uncultured Actinomyces sp. TaxID=249061 RepID=UPI0028E9152D|nr:alpha/beta hydrolase [uncultured Actinomyces sp.]